MYVHFLALYLSIHTHTPRQMQSYTQKYSECKILITTDSTAETESFTIEYISGAIHSRENVGLAVLGLMLAVLYSVAWLSAVCFPLYVVCCAKHRTVVSVKQMDAAKDQLTRKREKIQIKPLPELKPGSDCRCKCGGLCQAWAQPNLYCKWPQCFRQV